MWSDVVEVVTNVLVFWYMINNYNILRYECSAICRFIGVDLDFARKPSVELWCTVGSSDANGRMHQCICAVLLDLVSIWIACMFDKFLAWYILVEYFKQLLENITEIFVKALMGLDCWNNTFTGPYLIDLDWTEIKLILGNSAYGYGRKSLWSVLQLCYRQPRSQGHLILFVILRGLLGPKTLCLSLECNVYLWVVAHALITLLELSDIYDSLPLRGRIILQERNPSFGWCW